MPASALYFTAPRTVEHRSVALDAPASDEVVVATDASAISAGTELLVYRDQMPTEVPVDATIDGLCEAFSYPLQYGYAAVGTVVETGENVADDWLDRSVFAFQPHQTRFVADPETLVTVPDGIPDSQATLLPTLETATNLVLDSEPALGERAVVFGAGGVGLCTTRLLASFPLDDLVVVDPLESRRETAAALGADETMTPDQARDALSDRDFAVELSGEPTALDDAIDAVGYDGRVVVGSWYGAKQAPLNLGGEFHRNRIELVSSQVSTIDPARRGRWDRDRRFDIALEWLDRIDADRVISHRIPFAEADRAYELLDERPDDALQVVLTY